MADTYREDDSLQNIFKDFTAFIRGRHTPEQEARVREALENPNSELNEYLRAHEEWSKQRFPSAGSSPPAQHAWSQRPARLRLDAILKYVQRKHVEGVFTGEEVALFGRVGPGGQPFPAPPVSSVECNAYATRLLKAIEKAHPELRSELIPFRADRRR